MGTSADGETPRLPEPTGPFPVGVTFAHLKDASRPDPWASGVNTRELMISLWYPAVPSDGPRAPYMTPEESELLLAGDGIAGVPPHVLSLTRTGAAEDTPPDGPGRGCPLIVLSPGFTKPRATLTGLAEDLASHGYAVAGIDHAHESHGTSFPDGCIATGLAREAPRQGRWEKLMAGRAADVSFVLDELTAPDVPWTGAALIDPSRIAMAGHSAGGAAAISAVLADSRVRAGVNLDGAAFSPIPPGGLPRPFLFAGKEPREPALAKKKSAGSWDRDWTLLTGWKRQIVVEGAVHASFTDLALLAGQIGIDIGARLPGDRALAITRAYVRAFFDQHLHGTPQPLLDRPSSRYPEVRIRRAAD